MRLTLRSKWLLLALVLALGPVGVLTTLSGSIQRAGLRRAEQELGVAIVDQAAERVERVTDEAAEATHRVGVLLSEKSITNEDARLHLAEEAMARAEVLAHVAVYTAEGKLIDAIARAGQPKIPAPLPQIPAGVAEGGRWLAPEVDKGIVELRFAEALVKNGVRRGWVVGTLRPDALSERLAEVSKRRFERADRVLLVDGEQRVLAGPQPGISLSGRDIFSVARTMPGQQMAATLEFDDAEKGAMVGTIRTLPEHGWAIVVRRPEKEAYAALGSARRAFGLAALAVGLVAALVGALAAARTARPIEALVKLVEAYAARRFAERAGKAVATGDEVQALGGALERMADELMSSERELEKKTRAQSALARFLPEGMATAVVEGRHALTLGGERKNVTILFADVVGFTRFAETAPPERVVEFLNELFSVLTEVVFRHGGTVDKFIGDSVMAFFGAPEVQADHATRALGAAEDMHRFVEASAPAWLEKYGFDARLAVGINSGEAVVGNLGSESRMQYTVVGDAVNVAALLENLARPGQTLLTLEVSRQVSDPTFGFVPVGSHPLRGKARPVEVLELGR
jgi:class 3 adenylate cyclase